MEGDVGVLKIGKLLAEKGLPFLAENEHEGSVTCGCIDRSKGHDVEGVQNTLRASETEFMTIGMADTDLVEARFGVNADPV